VEKEGHLFAKRRASFSKTKRFFLKNEGHRFFVFSKQLIISDLENCGFWREVLVILYGAGRTE